MNNQKNNISSLNIPPSEKPRVVIIGGGFGGIHFLKHIDKKKFQTVLLDRYNYHTFQPLLYQVATAGLEPDAISGPLRKIIKNSREVYFRMVKVNRIDPSEKTIITSSGNLSFDFLIVATGSKTNFFGNQDIAENSFPLKQVPQALDLRSQLFQEFEKLELLNKSERDQKFMNFVVVGAGPTGVEVCGALAELKKHVLSKDYPDLDIENVQIFLVEGLGRVLPAMSEKSSQKAHHYLEKMGVKIIVNAMIEAYDGSTATLSIDKEIRADTLIWTAGVQGNLPDGFNDKSIEKGKLRVNPFNQVYKDINSQTSYESIFAIGDIAIQKSNKYKKGHPGLAQVAIQQGKLVAKNLNRKIKNQPFKEFQYKNKGVLATIGRNKAVADLPGGLFVSGFAGWFLWMSVHIMFLVGFRSKLIAFSNWVWNYFTFDRGIRLIIRPSPKKQDKISSEIVNEMKSSAH